MVTAEYRYDANGNRTMVISEGDTTIATYDGQDRMLAYGNASYSYGPRGDLQQKIAGTDTTTYNYDNVGNLRSVVMPDGKVIEYIIDGQNRRVAKKVNGQITKRWLYTSGLMPVAELDATGSVAKRYGPGYIVKNDTTYRVIKDHLGSVRMIVNSQTGQVIQRIDYDAWGQITHLQNQQEFTDIGFAGGLYDRHTGLVRFGARDYDPQTGRWTSKDPILFDGGTSNLYEYALNDPVNLVDPDGLQPVKNDNQSSSFQGFGMSFGGTAAFASLGLTFEAGFIDDQNGGRTGFVSIGPAVGVDLSVEGNILRVDNLNVDRPFKGEMLEGKGLCYNVGAGPVNLGYGGDINQQAFNENKTVRFPGNYTVSKLGVTAGPPISGSINVTETYTFPLARTFFGLMLTPNPF